MQVTIHKEMTSFPFQLNIIDRTDYGLLSFFLLSYGLKIWEILHRTVENEKVVSDALCLNDLDREWYQSFVLTMVLDFIKIHKEGMW